jgi:hypothetical protein
MLRVMRSLGNVHPYHECVAHHCSGFIWFFRRVFGSVNGRLRRTAGCSVNSQSYVFRRPVFAVQSHVVARCRLISDNAGKMIAIVPMACMTA